jgi:hypothetical protein
VSNLRSALKSAVNYDVLPAGPCHAALVLALGEGRQPRKGYDGKPDRQEYGLVLGWEMSLPGRPLLLQHLHYSDHEKSNWFKQVTAMLGRLPQTDADFDAESYLGKTFLVVVKHTEGSRGDRVFADVLSVSAPLPGAPAVVPQRTPQIWVVGDSAIPGWVDQLPRVFGLTPRQRIERSPEFKAWQAGQVNNTAIPAPGPQAAGTGGLVVDAHTTSRDPAAVQAAAERLFRNAGNRAAGDPSRPPPPIPGGSGLPDGVEAVDDSDAEEPAY